MDEIMDKERAAFAWVKSGVKDFYIGYFLINNVFPWDVHFYYSQGLEKILKAYIIASEESKYKDLNLEKAKDTINDIAKSKGHSLDKMINELIKDKVLEDSVLTEQYPPFGSGHNMIRILLKAYEQCRYPMPDSSSRNYPVRKHGTIRHDPMGSSSPRDFAFKVAKKTIVALKHNHAISISTEKTNYSTSITDEDWKRFQRLVFDIS